ncbi:MAG TPA: hypothetical protein VGI95_08390 [Caulobacteraceae bacterium]|jgi:hypothetical protein
MPLLLLLALLLLAPAASFAQSPPPPLGWASAVANDGVVMVSPKRDASQRVALTLLPVMIPAAPVKAWFGNEAVGLAKGFGTFAGATDVMEDGAILLRIAKVQTANGLEIRAIFYGYASPHGYQIAVLMIPPKVGDNDPRLQVATDYVERLAAAHFDLVLPRSQAQAGPSQMPNLGPAAPRMSPQGGPIYQARPVLGPGHDVPLKGVYFMAGFADGAVYGGVGTTMTFGQHAVQQLMLLYANGVAVKADVTGGNLAGHHQSEGFATLDVTDPRVVSQGGFGRWSQQGGTITVNWNYAQPSVLTRNGANLEGRGERWSPYHLADGDRLEGLFVRRMEAGLRSQAIVLKPDGTFQADGVNVVLGGEIVMPQFPAQGVGTYQITKGSMILAFSNGFTVAVACVIDGNTVLLNNFPFVRER